MIPCVIYAAKSTEDLRGSLIAQAADCREAIAEEGERTVVAEYSDQAVSGFSRSRGAGLSQALDQVKALATEHDRAELWVQHSDRLARGDGRTARHLVEIALWALKSSVAVRTVEDVDTFRDLLYAVVTGQRNHEDSKRKGASSAAGVKRAVFRGEYVGQPLDGYRVIVTADEHGHVTKTLGLDEARAPLFRVIFRMARRGATSGEIARKVTKDGWTTAPSKRPLSPGPISPAFIRFILKNPRYAGLAAYKGEIVGRGQWPAYISKREHERLIAQLRTYKPRRRPRQPYLLAHLAGCRLCGSYMITATGPVRVDGTRSRRYICQGHRWAQCEAKPVDAVIVDHVLVAHLNRFLGGPEDDGPYRPSPGFPRELLRGDPSDGWERIQPVASVTAELKVRIQAALAARDDELAEELLDELIGHRERIQALVNRPQPDVRIHNPLLSEDPLTALLDFYDWSGKDLAGTLRSGDETERLNRMLRRWFDRVVLGTTPRGIEIAPLPALASGLQEQPIPAYASIESWRVTLQVAGPGHRGKDPWLRPEIIQALKAWSAANGRHPRVRDWEPAGPGHPNSSTVFARFGSWEDALRAADIEPRPVPRHSYRENGAFAVRPQ
jgi:DNA invertase Pin-like site-specific DNA recombinase